MIINPVELVESNDEVKIQSLIEYSGKKKYLWYSFPKKYKQYLTTEKLDGFLVGLLLLAMKRGEDIEVKGAISEKLFFNLTHGYIQVMKIVRPDLKKIKIKAEKLDNGENAKSKGGVVTGFSGGIDSFSTIYEHYFNAPSPSYKLTHFIFNNVGNHDEWDAKRGRELFNKRYNLLKGYPEELGLDFIKIDSNLSDIVKMDFESTHQNRNASSVLLLQKLFSKYYYSSAYQYKDCGLVAKGGLAKADPISVHLLSTETLECISTGCEISRVEKSRRVTEVPNANLWLNVCVHSQDGKNCSICIKCVETLFSIEFFGKLEEFNQTFDLNLYRKQRPLFIVEMLANKDSRLLREIQDYAKKVRYPFKPWQIVAAKFYNPKIITACIPISKFVKSVIKRKKLP